MNIAVLGTGSVGRAIAGRLHELGQDVAVGTRDPQATLARTGPDAMGTAPFRRAWRAALDKIQETLWTDVLMRQTFTAAGAAQFSRDVTAVVSLAERHLGAAGGGAAMASLREALLLLNLPVDPAAGDDRLSLQEASDRVFTDNAEAKAALDELGIESISPANARQILQRRVEASE